MARKTVAQRNKELAKENKILRHFGLKLRAYPTPYQEELIAKTIGCARFSFNFYLKERIEVYNLTKLSLSCNTFKKSFNVIKQHPMFNWLKEVDKFALECALEQVEDAYDRFFKGQNGFPKFKSKHRSKQSYSTKETNGNIQLDIQDEVVKLPKVGKVHISLSKKHRAMFQQNGLTAKIKSATVTRHSSGQYYISLKFEEIVPLEAKQDVQTIPSDQIIGCDLGLTHFLIDSNGRKVENPRYLKNNLKKLARLQRRLKHKKMGSSNSQKLKQKISKLHLHIANMRKDFLHKESRKLVNENQVIILEDLNVKGMIKNKKLARHIADVSWGMFTTFVSYKANWEGKHVVLVDRFFPSSKQCHGCKEKNTLLSLSDRVWVCPSCGTEHDRDQNAALNIKEEGIRLLLSA